MKSLPDLVDENGDINLHGRQGAVITIPFVNDDGTARDVSASTMVFECGTALNIPLTNGGAANEKVLTISNADVKTMFALKDRQFVVMDNSTGVATPQWMGTVHVYGWVE